MRCFESLGLPDSATADEVKRAWRQLAMAHHPDRGGDPSEFDRLRKLYDEALAVAEAPKPCATCNGSGKVRRAHGWTSIELACEVCGGSGDET
jgi:DnaJ-class molecular chaperone